MKFEIQNLDCAGYYLFDKSQFELISLGNICLWKQNKKYKSFCFEMNNNFNYHGIRYALTGTEKNEYNVMPFIPRRLLVIQMK